MDECLPPSIAEVLCSVGYPISSNRAENVDGMDDAQLIPWLAQHRYIWVTKDDAAKTAHRNAIQQARVSVVCVRGAERQSGTTAKNNISIKDLHRMLTDKLDEILEEVDRVRGPRYFLLFMRGRAPVLKKFSTLDEVTGQLAGPGRRRASQNR